MRNTFLRIGGLVLLLIWAVFFIKNFVVTKNPGTIEGWVILVIFSVIVFLVFGITVAMAAHPFIVNEKIKSKKLLLFGTSAVLITGIFIVPALFDFFGKTWSKIYNFYISYF